MGRFFEKNLLFLKTQIVYDNWERVNQEAIDYEEANKIAADLANKGTQKVSTKMGKEYH